MVEGYQSFSTPFLPVGRGNLTLPYINGRYVQESWVRFGEGNLYPEMLNQMYYSSPLHGAIVDFKTNAVIGGGFNLTTDKLTPQEKLGIEDNNFLKNFLITALGNTDLKDVPKLFTECEFLTRKIAESVPEAYLRQLEYEKGMGGDFMDYVRNSLYDVIKQSDFADKIESKISGIVCPLVERMSSKFTEQLGTMKSSLISNPMNIQA